MAVLFSCALFFRRGNLTLSESLKGPQTGTVIIRVWHLAGHEISRESRNSAVSELRTKDRRSPQPST